MHTSTCIQKHVLHAFANSLNLLIAHYSLTLKMDRRPKKFFGGERRSRWTQLRYGTTWQSPILAYTMPCGLSQLFRRSGSCLRLFSPTSACNHLSHVAISLTSCLSLIIYLTRLFLSLHVCLVDACCCICWNDRISSEACLRRLAGDSSRIYWRHDCSGNEREITWSCWCDDNSK